MVFFFSIFATALLKIRFFSGISKNLSEIIPSLIWFWLALPYENDVVICILGLYSLWSDLLLNGKNFLPDKKARRYK